MSHSLKPNEKYNLVTLTVAIPECSPHDQADLLNEMLRPVVQEGEIADYTLYALKRAEQAETGEDPEEGCLFPATAFEENPALALQACRELVFANRQGFENGGSMDWDDIARASMTAYAALGLDMAKDEAAILARTEEE